MMNRRTCRRVRRELSAYLDQELEEAQRQLVANHVAVCPDCQHELEELARVWQLLDMDEQPALTLQQTQQWTRHFCNITLSRLPTVRSIPSQRLGMWWRVSVVVLVLIGLVLIYLGTRCPGASSRYLAAPPQQLLQDPDLPLYQGLEVLENFETLLHFQKVLNTKPGR